VPVLPRVPGRAAPAEPRWAQVIDIEILRKVTEVLLPGLACGGCGTITHAAPPPGFHPGSVAYGPVLNAAAVLLSCHGNVPTERAARLIGMLTGEGRLRRLGGQGRRPDERAATGGGFDEAMAASLAEDVLAADETPVDVLDKTPLPAHAADDAGEADRRRRPPQGHSTTPHPAHQRTHQRGRGTPSRPRRPGRPQRQIPRKPT